MWAKPSSSEFSFSLLFLFIIQHAKLEGQIKHPEQDEKWNVELEHLKAI